MGNCKRKTRLIATNRPEEAHGQQRGPKPASSLCLVLRCTVLQEPGCEPQTHIPCTAIRISHSLHRLVSSLSGCTPSPSTTFATLLLTRGDHPRSSKELLGHSTTVFALDTYSHVLLDMQDHVTRALEDVQAAGLQYAWQ